MDFTITTLIENNVDKEPLLAEHGLSLHITNGDKSILFDTGRTGNFIKNAAVMKIDLNTIDYLILSHGHHDHAGGVKAYLEQFQKPKELYVGRTFFDARYIADNGCYRYIGCPFDEVYLKEKDVTSFTVVNPIQPLFDSVSIVTGFTPTNTFEPLPESLVRYRNGEYIPDRFEDEISLVIERKEGLVLICGCSHIGIVNICTDVMKKFNRNISVFIGGTHLMNADDNRICQTIDFFRKHNIEMVGACHCNGEHAGELFQMELPHFYANRTGTVTTIACE